MEKFVIQGGVPLKGRLKVRGAKNSALPLMCASILAEGKSQLLNVPHLMDIVTMQQVLEGLGVKVSRKDRTLEIDSTNLSGYQAPYELIKKMRASILVLGPLLARYGKAEICLPGGCCIGRRPVNLHLEGLRKLGARIKVKRGYIEAYTNGLKGNSVHFDLPSVGATENLMLSACLSEGETVIRNASLTPEVVDLARFLREMGAEIQGEGTSVIRISGVQRLRPARHSIIPDRITAGTLIMAIIASGGEATLEGIRPDHLGIIFTKLREIGTEIEVNGDHVRVKAGDYLRPLRIKTLPYPGFPTDLQPQITSLACVARGTSVVTETIFETRFSHLPELRKMGAKTKQEGAGVVVEGIPYLSGNLVRASDIRGGAALVLAGLAARGTTIIEEIHHIDRGYEELEKDLSRLGANIVRVKE